MPLSDKDYYEILGVSKDASPEQVKRAFRKLALQYHPDKNKGDKETEQRFKEIANAYEVLSDPDKRKAYDSRGAAGVEDMGFHGFQTNEDIFSSFGDVFGDLFADRYYGRHPGPEPGRDLTTDVKVSFREAALGARRELSFNKPTTCTVCKGTGSADGQPPQRCSTCGGRGRVSRQDRRVGGFFSISSPCPACGGSGRTVGSPCKACQGTGIVEAPFAVTVSIPAGVETGSVLRLSKQGEPGLRGGPAGDLLIRLTVEPDLVFSRRGDDLLYKATVPFTSLALGGDMEVPTLRGRAKMKIPPGTQSGQTLRLAGQGIARPAGKGDLLVTVEAEVPRKADERCKALLEELRKLGG